MRSIPSFFELNNFLLDIDEKQQQDARSETSRRKKILFFIYCQFYRQGLTLADQ